LARPNDASRSDAIAMNTMSSVADAPNAEFAITLVFAFDGGSRWVYRFTSKVWHSSRVNDSEVIDQYFVSWFSIPLNNAVLYFGGEFRSAPALRSWKC
jgi:hypothetical protein